MLNRNNGHYICALDIGSTKISGAVAEIRSKSIINITCDTVLSSSLKNGVIVNSMDLVNETGLILKKLKAKSGLKIREVYVNISGEDIIVKNSHAIIPLAERGNKIVTKRDISRVIEQARILGSSLEEEIIHQIPTNYSIDSMHKVENPIDLYSHKLEAELYLICVKLVSVQNLLRVVSQAGYEVKDVYFSGLATGKAMLGKDYIGKKTLVCDIGGDFTEMSFFYGDAIRDIDILYEGGNSLTSRLCDELKIPFELAEDVKRSYGIIGDNAVNEDKEILIKKDNIYKPIKQKFVSEIITSQVNILCQDIKRAIEKKTALSGLDYLFLCGRTVLLEGFLEALEHALGCPVKLARFYDRHIFDLLKKNPDFSGHKYITYVTALGMISQAIHSKRHQEKDQLSSSKNPLFDLLNRVSEVYQEYF
ncbi:MAG: cell division protein FtsA [Candidatus Omnitrophota bacterium]|jgi:cell division protein FtsA|nr:MAG: cell division protein FtsA [Candidatus Omnitrophota bacterium]